MDTLTIKINIPAGKDVWKDVSQKINRIEKIIEFINDLSAECDEIIKSGHYDGEKLKDMIDFDSRNDYLQNIIKAVDDRHCSDDN